MSNELYRFLVVCRDTLAAITARRPHNLDDRHALQSLIESASHLAVAVEKTTRAHGLNHTLDDPRVWTADVPAVRQRSNLRWGWLLIAVLVLAAIAAFALV